MTAFYEATCPKCRKHIGWRGGILDHPPCPRCGHRIDKEVLTKDAAKIAKIREDIMITLCKEDFDRQGYYCCFQCKKYRPDDPIMKCKVPGMIACDSPYNGECLSCLHFEPIALMKKKEINHEGFPDKNLKEERCRETSEISGSKEKSMGVRHRLPLDRKIDSEDSRSRFA